MELLAVRHAEVDVVFGGVNLPGVLDLRVGDEEEAGLAGGAHREFNSIDCPLSTCFAHEQFLVPVYSQRLLPVHVSSAASSSKSPEVMY